MAKGKSARGEIVDFDLLKIKEQIASAPKTTNVRAREDFIDQKFKRRIRKITETAVTTTQAAGAIDTAPAGVVVVAKPEEVTNTVVAVDPPPAKKIRIAPATK